MIRQPHDAMILDPLCPALPEGWLGTVGCAMAEWEALTLTVVVLAAAAGVALWLHVRRRRAEALRSLPFLVIPPGSRSGGAPPSLEPERGARGTARLLGATAARALNAIAPVAASAQARGREIPARFGEAVRRANLGALPGALLRVLRAVGSVMVRAATWGARTVAGWRARRAAPPPAPAGDRTQVRSASPLTPEVLLLLFAGVGLGSITGALVAVWAVGGGQAVPSASSAPADAIPISAVEAESRDAEPPASVAAGAEDADAGEPGSASSAEAIADPAPATVSDPPAASERSEPDWRVTARQNARQLWHRSRAALDRVGRHAVAFSAELWAKLEDRLARP